MAMTLEQYYLTKIAEECAEVAQRSSKAIIFGVDDVEPGQPHNNIDRMLLEYEDLKVVMDRFFEITGIESGLTYEDLKNHRFNKRLKLIHHEKYSRSRGQVE